MVYSALTVAKELFQELPNDTNLVFKAFAISRKQWVSCQQSRLLWMTI